MQKPLQTQIPLTRTLGLHPFDCGRGDQSSNLSSDLQPLHPLVNNRRIRLDPLLSVMAGHSVSGAAIPVVLAGPGTGCMNAVLERARLQGHKYRKMIAGFSPCSLFLLTFSVSSDFFSKLFSRGPGDRARRSGFLLLGWGRTGLRRRGGLSRANKVRKRTRALASAGSFSAYFRTAEDRLARFRITSAATALVDAQHEVSAPSNPRAEARWP